MVTVLLMVTLQGIYSSWDDDCLGNVTNLEKVITKGIVTVIGRMTLGMVTVLGMTCVLGMIMMVGSANSRNFV